MTPFTAVPNQIPLTENIATAPACGLDTTPPRTEHDPDRRGRSRRTEAAAAAWTAWLAKQKTTGNGAIADFANPEQMNRYTWYATHDWTVPYPGDAKLYAPEDVPGGTSRPPRQLTRRHTTQQATARRDSGGPGKSRGPSSCKSLFLMGSYRRFLHRHWLAEGKAGRRAAGR